MNRQSCVKLPFPSLHGQPVHPLILEPSELERLLDDEQLLIVDLCRPETWTQGHIPGAVHVAPTDLIAGIKPAVGKLPAIERLNALFGQLGYAPDKHIVAYDDEGGGWAGRFIWTLDVIGHASSSLLNGGIIAWAGEGRPLDHADASPEPVDLQLEIDRRFIATLPQILDSLGDQHTVIWDARSREEYLGTRQVSARGGHIPGAVNLDWMDVMDKNNGCRIRADIADLLQGLGITPDKRVITHCQTHHRSGLTYVVGKSLGYDIQAYDGSWSEWGNVADTPVES